jgi:hypothetical protein
MVGRPRATAENFVRRDAGWASHLRNGRCQFGITPLNILF